MIIYIKIKTYFYLKSAGLYRLEHALDGLKINGELPGIDKMGLVIKAMVDDILREGSKEIIDSKEARRAISTRAAMLFKNKLKENIE